MAYLCLGHAAHELSDTLNTAILAFHTLKRGAVAINGSTGGILGRSLMSLRELVDRTLSEVRLGAGTQRRARLSVVAFIDEIAATGLLHSEYREIQFSIPPIDPTLSIDADSQLLASAVMNLLHNAFKNTPSGGSVVLRARAEQGRLLIETEDECGGIPQGKSDLFQVFGDRRFALVDGGDVPASAMQYDLAAVLDQQPASVCGIAGIFPPLPAGGPARELVDRLLEQAARDGAAMALLFSDMRDEQQIGGFDLVPMIDVEIGVAEPLRRGAPMTLIRGGEERDLAAIVAMGRIRAEAFRFHLDRDVDFVQYAITKKRLLAGLGTAGARQLHFFIAEEGITAAAYVVVSIVGGTWTVEECGDRDPCGASRRHSAGAHRT